LSPERLARKGKAYFADKKWPGPNRRDSAPGRYRLLVIVVAVVVIVVIIPIVVVVIAIVFLVPMMVVLDAAMIAIPIANEIALPIMMWWHPMSADVRRTRPIAFVPFVVISDGIPVALNPHEVRSGAGWHDSNNARRRRRANANADGDLCASCRRTQSRQKKEKQNAELDWVLHRLVSLSVLQTNWVPCFML